MEQLAAYLEDTLRIDPASASTVSSQAKSIWSQSVIPNTSRMNGSGYGTHPHGSLYDRYQPTHPPGLHQNQFASPQQPRGGPISAHAPRYGYTSHQQVRAYDDPQMQQEGVYRDTQALPHHIAPPPGFDLPPIPQLSSLGHVNVSTRQAQGIPIHAPSHSQAQGLGTFYPPHSSQAQQQQQQSQAYQIQPQYAPNSGHNQSSYYSPSPPNSNSMPNSMPISIQSMNTHQQNLSRSLNSGYSNSNSNSHFSPHSYNMPGYLHHAHSQSHDNTPSQTRDYSYNVGFTIGGRMEPSSGSNNSSLSAGMYYEPPRNGTGAKKSKFAFANKESVDITDNNV
ncbi:hypothetical protein SARC_16143 [Sphaeroforma arctica JP610]|uniref:Uncharacterized protein n=1 Tax=Sphaeroforma arctica JP610 TaxID=667725 RepID=A0A0L0F3L2_9EUKA|nr:hypothetical protein SARC_16143 [Sphaeroforma arctica JP610]KNC71320.1 hypothetical protein SARC_16143 [Sphaeroforma arctica JP610]|eukprot:XP_014145222.1 hypothetical protein SARC_16143 [Sphaeroforma arctica JP610]